MKQGWEIKRLGEVLVKTEMVDPTKCPDKEFTYLDVSSVNKETKEIQGANVLLGKDAPSRARKLVKENDVIFATVRPTHSRVALITEEYDGQVCSTGYFILRGKENIDNKYLFYFLLTDEFNKQMEKLQKGASYPAVTDAEVKSNFIRYPKSLPEQQRIVSILDEAFAAIAKAKANAEQNLKNAKELFESYLQGVFEKKGDGWEHTRLGDICQVNDGTHFSPKNNSEGEYMYVTAKNIKPYFIDLSNISYVSEKDHKEIYSRCSPKKGDVLYIKDGATAGIATINTIEEEFSMLSSVALLKCSNRILNTFLVHYMNSNVGKKNFLGYLDGAAITRLTLIKIKNVCFPLPPLKDQQTIVHQLDALRAETQKLEVVYQKKIGDLEELKKSILQKAFAGELISTSIAVVSDTKIIPLQKVEGISPTDLQAGITAMALQRHIEQNKQHSFHHVKAEKIVHLSEYILSIDLERNPVKDAAGPNDFPHAKKVESRARKAGFYTVYKNGEHYDYQQGNNIQALVQKAQKSLGDKATTLSQIVDTLLPMSTQQAEIVATVYAAWNNLILYGNLFSDDDIVTESRENWREEKLKIPREKFFGAIDWMKKNELFIPKGNGKVVTKK